MSKRWQAVMLVTGIGVLVGNSALDYLEAWDKDCQKAGLRYYLSKRACAPGAAVPVTREQEHRFRENPSVPGGMLKGWATSEEKKPN
jgi:hypothetical protein